MKLTRAENTLMTNNGIIFQNGRAMVHTASGKIAFIEPNYMNINRQYFSAYTIGEDLNRTMITTRATLSTIIKKLKAL